MQYFRSLLRNLTGEQYEDVLNVCSMFPVIDMVVKPHGESSAKATGTCDKMCSAVQCSAVQCSAVPHIFCYYGLDFVCCIMFKQSICNSQMFSCGPDFKLKQKDYKLLLV